MRYLAQPDEAAAIARSRAEALARGCVPDAGTQTWWPWQTDPETGAAVLLIGDNDALRPDEAAADTPPDWLS